MASSRFHLAVDPLRIWSKMANIHSSVSIIFQPIKPSFHACSAARNDVQMTDIANAITSLFRPPTSQTEHRKLFAANHNHVLGLIF